VADAVTDLLKRKIAALESAYSEIRRRFDRASENGLDTLTSQSLFVAPMLHGPYRNSVDGTHSMTFIVDYDENIAYLYSAKLKLRLAAVRSNVSASSSASGGGSAPTSSAGSAHTHSVSQSLTGASGGGTTVSSAGGSSHSHTVSSATSAVTVDVGIDVDGFPLPANGSSRTTSGGSSHNHASATTDDAPPNNPHQHAVSGGSGSESSHTHTVSAHTYTVPSFLHTHGVSGQTAAAESSHTHSVTLSDHTHTISGTITAASESAHTHSVTISAHSHTITLTYGIYEGSAPSAPAITITINGVNRTTALGGSWNADTTLDITDYLRDTAKIPLRQDNTIVLTSAELIDLEVVCRSLVTTRLVTT